MNEQKLTLEEVNMHEEDLGYFTLFKRSLFERYIDFSGKSTREELWVYLIFGNIIAIILSLIFPPAGAVFSLAFFLPTIALWTRRIRDTGLPGWWGWLFIPTIIPLVFIAFTPTNYFKSISKKVVTKIDDSLSKNSETCGIEDNDNHFFTQVIEEIENGFKDKGITGKAYALAEGDSAKADALYIKIRAKELENKHIEEVNEKTKREDAERIAISRKKVKAFFIGIMHLLIALLIAFIVLGITISSNLFGWGYMNTETSLGFFLGFILIILYYKFVVRDIKKGMMIFLYTAISLTTIVLIANYISDRNRDKADLKEKMTLQKACDGGDAHKCFKLSDIYKYGDPKKEEEFYQKGIKIYEKDCNKGNLESCVAVGDLSYEENNYFTAVNFYKKACNSGSPKGCIRLRNRYDRGEGVKLSHDTALLYHKKAIEIYNKHCNDGNASDCLTLGKIQSTNHNKDYGDYTNYKYSDTNKAKEAYGKACDGGIEEGCEEYAEH